MTAQIVTGAVVAPAADARLAGVGPLFRKDVAEWVRGRRAWVIAIVVTAFMALTAANGWITAQIAAAVPDDVAPPQVGSQLPLDNVLAAVGAQVWVLAAIFAVGSLIVAERQVGTLSWVASKPVSRAAIWTSKWLSSTAMLTLSAVVVPMAVTVGLAVALYGMPPVAAVAGLLVGMILVTAFFAAVGLAAGTILPGQPAVIAAGFGVFALVPMLTALVPFDVSAFLPTSILTWVPMALSGEPVSFVTPLAFAIETAVVVEFALDRMVRMEL